MSGFEKRGIISNGDMGLSNILCPLVARPKSFNARARCASCIMYTSSIIVAFERTALGLAKWVLNNLVLVT